MQGKQTEIKLNFKKVILLGAMFTFSLFHYSPLNLHDVDTDHGYRKTTKQILQLVNNIK